ncbi:tryptophan 7-halogenase, partial [Methyloceanibacter marginalis]|uniref:tryptophan 7-halogenase n=1 Tax=Methyloceanibacter marginalis TaxID=1774971 RepID=UPI00114CFA26
AEIVRGNLAPRRPGEPEFSGEVGYTYHFDATKLAGFLKDIATGRGVKHVLDDVDKVNLDERGFVKSLSLRERGEHDVDLVIDCTGFRGSILQQALGEPFEPYGDYLLTTAPPSCRSRTRIRASSRRRRGRRASPPAGISTSR